MFRTFQTLNKMCEVVEIYVPECSTLFQQHNVPGLQISCCCAPRTTKPCVYVYILHCTLLFTLHYLQILCDSSIADCKEIPNAEGFGL